MQEKLNEKINELRADGRTTGYFFNWAESKFTDEGIRINGVVKQKISVVGSTKKNPNTVPVTVGIDFICPLDDFEQALRSTIAVNWLARRYKDQSRETLEQLNGSILTEICDIMPDKSNGNAVMNTKCKIAMKLIDKGMDAQTVAMIAELPIEVVNNLINPVKENKAEKVLTDEELKSVMEEIEEYKGLGMTPEKTKFAIEKAWKEEMSSSQWSAVLSNIKSAYKD